MIPGYPLAKKTVSPSGKRIIQHYGHDFDQKGRVIVVETEKEDRQEFINSFYETCGLKNIIKLLLKQGEDPLDGRFSYDDKKDAVDVSDLPTNINDLHEAASSSSKVASDAVEAFNKTYGTSYTVDEFLKKSSDGSLLTEVTELLKAKDIEKSKEKGDGLDGK